MKEQFPEVEASQLKAALKKGVTAKVLEQNGQRSLLKKISTLEMKKKHFTGFGWQELHPHHLHQRRQLTLLKWRWQIHQKMEHISLH